MKKWLVSGFCNPIEVNVIQQAGITYYNDIDDKTFYQTDENDHFFDTKEEAEAYRNELIRPFTGENLRRYIEYRIDNGDYSLLPSYVEERMKDTCKYFTYDERQAIREALRGNICIEATSFRQSQVKRLLYGEDSIKVIIDDGTELMARSEVEKFIVTSIFGGNTSDKVFTSF